MNGFSIAGGYIYLSRKIIVDAKSEDEIAGVLAHEIGHIYTHQVAAVLTREMKYRLNLSTLGGRDDVWDKYQQMFNAQPKIGEGQDLADAEKNELRADAVGLYALMRAGYAPSALAANLERVADNKGRNGNFFSDVLGGTNEVGMRVRSAERIANGAPDECKRREFRSSPEFLSFQQSMASYVVNSLQPPTPGLNPVKLDSPIRPGLNWVRFSSDGKYVLAQNEAYIFVLSSTPLKQLFQIYAPGASAAQFTPDSKHLVFHFQSLRVEDWDVETGKRVQVHELVEYRGCDQSELSPDGKLLACVLRIRDSWQISLELFDVQSGKIVFQKGDGFLTDDRAQIYKIISRPDWDPELLAIAFSPDSHYLFVAAVASRLALDLQSLKPVKLGLGLGSVAQGRLTFTAPDQVMYDCDAGERAIFRQPQSNVCVVEFPTGVPVIKFVEGWESLLPVAQGNYIVAGTLFDSIPHLVELSTGKVLTALKFPAADVHGKLMARESGNGGITVGEIGSPTVDTIDLPDAPLPYVRTARFSPDGKYLALSNESRGAVWDIPSNKRMVLTRSFRGAWFDASAQSGPPQLFLQLAAGQGKAGMNLRFDIKTGASAETGKYGYERRQKLDVSVEVIPNNPDRDRSHNINLEVYDDKTGNLLWERHFPKDAPEVTQQEPGELILTFGMEKETAWDEIAHNSPVITSDASKEKHQGLLVEVVNSQTGAVLRQLIGPEGSRVQWSNNSRYLESYESDDRSAASYGDMVAIHGNNRNTVIYNAKTGARLMALWGTSVAGDSTLGLIAATNRDQELIVYEAATGRERLHVTVDHAVESARFVPEKKQLLVVTRGQNLYTLDVSGNTSPASANGTN